MVAQFLAGGSIYILLLLLTLGEEFKHCPAPLQSLCCWVHETKCARTILTLTAISINFGVASSDIVSRFSSKFQNLLGKNKRFHLPSSPPLFHSPSISSLQLWCDSSKTHINRSDPASAWPAINICTHPEVSDSTFLFLFSLI